MRDLNLTKPPAPGDYFPHAARIRANQRTADDQGRM
jgi:hypothetical protein